MDFLKNMYGKMFQGNIKNRIILYSVGLLLVNLVTIGFLSYKISSSSITRIISQTSTKILNQSMENIDFILKGIEYEAINVFDNVDLDGFLDEMSDCTYSRRVEIEKAMQFKIDKLMNIRDHVEYVYIIGENGVIYSNGTGAKMEKIDKGYFREILEESEGRFIWTYMTKEGFEASSSKRIVMCRSILDGEDRYNGFIMIMLKERHFSDIYENLYQGKRQIFLVNQNYSIVSCPEKSLIGFQLKGIYRVGDDEDYAIRMIGRQKYLISHTGSDYTKWKLYIAEPYVDIFSYIREFRMWIVFFSISGMLGLIVLSVILSTMVTVPIKHLLESTHLINNSDYNEDVFSEFAKRQVKKKRGSKLFCRFRFKTKLSIMLIGIVMLPILALILVSYNITCNIVESKAVEVNNLNTRQMKKRVEYYIKNFEKSIYCIYSEDGLVDVLRSINSNSGSEEDRNEDNREITVNGSDLLENVLGNMERQNRDIFYISLYDRNHNLIISSKYRNMEIPDKLFKHIDKYVETKNIWFNTIKNHYNENVITLGKKIKDFNDFYELGYMFITIRETDLENNYAEAAKDRDMSFIISNDAVVISHPDNNMLGQALEDDYINKILAGSGTGWLKERKGKEELLISFDTVNNVGWKIVNVSSIEEEKANMERIIFYNLLVFLLSSLGVLTIIFYISGKISRPINELTARVSGFANDDLDYTGTISTGDEIEQLSIDFNKMMLRIKTLIEEVYEAKIKKHEAELCQKEAELVTLQAQINPHFLYNTLEIIRWKAMFLTNGENEVTDMVTTLSDFFRLSLSKGRKIVMLKEEVEHARNYINIINYRYNNKIAVNWSIDTSILDCIVPKIILQPLVENAVYHGIKPKQGQGIINVSASLDDRSIKLCIQDNGIGMDKADVEKMNSLISNVNTETKAGYGLRNVNQRIKLYFGQEYGLTLASVKGEGTTVLIFIPAIDQKDKQDNKSINV